MSALGWPGAPCACAAAVEINQSILQCPRKSAENLGKTSLRGGVVRHPATAGVGKERRIIHTVLTATNAARRPGHPARYTGGPFEDSGPPPLHAFARRPDPVAADPAERILRPVRN